MKYIILMMFYLNSFLIAQDLSGDYELLAKYTILKYSIIKNFHNEADSLFLAGSINDTEEIIRTNNYSYEVDSIYQYNNFRIISIIDKTNFQLHFFNYKVYAIDISSQYGVKYYDIDKHNILEFINSHISHDNDGQRNIEVIKLYDKIFSYLHRYPSEVIFYNGKDLYEFKYLEGKFRFDDLLDNSSYFQNLYRIKDGDNIEYYHILYFFDCDGMKVENHLLYKIKL